MSSQGLRVTLYVLFTVSGFAGLMYETVWTYYLKLFLGHAAYAQTLVLAIFMGGMALGAWYSSRYSAQWTNVLRAYSITEGIIGLFGLVFHFAFQTVTDFSYDIIIPALGTPGIVGLFKWSLSALLILPQSLLLGMTFPLMSAALIRLFPRDTGACLSMLYFTNSLGAAIGVLFCGFVLVNAVGLPGVILVAALINVGIGIVVWFLAKTVETPAIELQTMPAAEDRWITGLPQLLLWVSLLTGTASFIYEIGWIRMLSLVLGSSTHAFEMMLSAFIFGLAFGGLWIRRRIDRLDSPERYLGYVQVVMGMSALSTLVMYGYSFEFMQATITALNKTEPGYFVFNIASHLLSLLFMFPTTFCAGMTLPLITYSLLKQGVGEKSIGIVYAVNTLGAIVGIFFSIHVGMPLLGLKGLITTGASLDLVLGVVLLWVALKRGRMFTPIFVTAVSITLVLLTVIGVKLDTLKMSSGVFRIGRLFSPMESEVVFHRDGKTATVDLVQHRSGRLVLETNGKPDAAINMNPLGQITGDEATMALLAALPMALSPEAKTVANIGFGSGMTSHVLLGNTTLDRVDTIEIEEAMIQGAQGFRPRVEAVFTDPRSKIHVEDAKTFFSTNNGGYDIIISEPSNPWVSGVASLFTEEFYRRIKGHLNNGGILGQWFHLYEMDTNLLASVLQALSNVFPAYVIYATTNEDILIVASKDGNLRLASQAVFDNPNVAKELARYGIRSVGDLELRRIGGKNLFQPWLVSLGMPPNSDYFPVLDLGATKARFFQRTAGQVVELVAVPLPVVEMLDGPRETGGTNTVAGEDRFFSRSVLSRRAGGIRDYYVKDHEIPVAVGVSVGLRKDMVLLKTRLLDCRQGKTSVSDIWFQAVSNMAGATNAYLPSAELKEIWKIVDSSSCVASLNAAQKTWLALYKAVGDRDAAGMARFAEELLSTDKDMSQNRRVYLLIAGMTGNIAQGNRTRSLDLWEKYSGQVLGGAEPSLLLRLLYAHSV